MTANVCRHFPVMSSGDGDGQGEVGGFSADMSELGYEKPLVRAGWVISLALIN